MESQLAGINKCEQEVSTASGIQCGQDEQVNDVQAKQEAPVQTTEDTGTELPMGDQSNVSYCDEQKPKDEVQSGSTSTIKKRTEENVLDAKEEKKDKAAHFPEGRETMAECTAGENKEELSNEPQTAVIINTSNVKDVESSIEKSHTNLPENPEVKDASESQIAQEAGKEAQGDLKVEFVKCSFDFTEKRGDNQPQDATLAPENADVKGAVESEIAKEIGNEVEADVENTEKKDDPDNQAQDASSAQNIADVKDAAEAQIAQEVEEGAKDDLKFECVTEKKDDTDSQAQDVSSAPEMADIKDAAEAQIAQEVREEAKNDLKFESVKCSFDFTEKKDDTDNQAQDTNSAVEESVTDINAQVKNTTGLQGTELNTSDIKDVESKIEEIGIDLQKTADVKDKAESSFKKETEDDVPPSESASAGTKNNAEDRENNTALEKPVEEMKVIPLQPSAPQAKEVEAVSTSSYVVLESGPSGKVDPEAQKTATAEEPPVYCIKWILWKGVKTPIVTQNVNGPCPLLAIVNVLLLKRQIVLPDQSDIVTSTRLLELIGDTILESVPKNIVETDKTNYEQNVNDALSILPKLQSGIDVNVKFNGISDFEYTLELALFDLVHIPLYHGWLVDRAEQNEVEAVGSSGYNQLVERIITAKSQENQDLFLKAEIAEAFLERTASQLTYQGLVDLSTTLQDDELAVFFRNNHFSTLYKTQNRLFTLVTDQGFLHESKVVWETLEDIDGSGQFVDANFMVDGKPLGGFTKDEQIGRDFQIAAQLQREADELQETSQLSRHTAAPMSDEQLARQLQEEEERRARPASTGSPVGPGPSSGDGKRNSLPAQAPPKKEEKKSFCVIM